MRDVRSLVAALILLPLVPVAAQAAEPGIDQIHALAAGGHVDQALAQMNGVLKAHPASAKAHYVEAELYARENHMAQGRSELARAEQIAPGLPFADVYSVAELNRRLALGPSTGAVPPAGQTVVREAGPHIPWGPIAALGVAALALFLMFRRRTRAVAPVIQQSPWAGSGYGPQGTAPGIWGNQMNGGVGTGMGGGMGSGLLGSLAGGAAMGAGFAAGEEVIDRMFGGERREEGRGAGNGYGTDFGASSQDTTNEDMGGNDFGITDDGSWDDSSTDGGGW